MSGIKYPVQLSATKQISIYSKKSNFFFKTSDQGLYLDLYELKEFSNPKQKESWLERMCLAVL